MSLRRRLQAGLGMAMSTVILALALLGGEAVRYVGEDLVASRLRHDAESLLAALQESPDGTLRLEGQRLGSIYERPYAGHYYVIATADDATLLRSRSLWDVHLSIPSLPAGETQRWHAQGPDDQQLLAWAAGYRKQGRDITVVVAEDLSALHVHLATVRWVLAGIGLVVVIGVLALQQRILRRGFEPLQQTAGDVERLAAGEINQLSEAVPDEVRPLVTEVNRLLELLDRRLQRSRNAAGNLAHALKTPLALLMQLTQDEALKSHPAIRSEMGVRITQIRQVIENELKRARLAGRAGRAQAFRPADDLPQLADVLHRIYEERHIRIDLDYPETLTLPLDRDDALELIGNLLDNACKWARGRVRLGIDGTVSGSLVVEDDGPGCSEERIQELTRRGTRLDEEIAGHGLGLAIVQEIADLYGAGLTFDQSPALGGLRVTVGFGMRPVRAKGATPEQSPIPNVHGDA